jgi:hypothetical protein
MGPTVEGGGPGSAQLLTLDIYAGEFERIRNAETIRERLSAAFGGLRDERG